MGALTSLPQSGTGGDPQNASCNIALTLPGPRFRYNPGAMTNENIQIVASDGAHSGQRILRLRGPLNIHTIFDFQAAVKKEEAPTLIVDFSGVPYIDSAGLGAVVGAFISAQRSNRKVAVAGMNERVKALVSMTHVSKLFQPYATVEDAERVIASSN
jgi:anti-sigma B factor antagonist